MPQNYFLFKQIWIIDFLSPDKGNNKITPSPSTSSTNLISNAQSVSKLATNKDLENIDEIVDKDDIDDTEDENYNTDDLVESDNLSDDSDGHNILSDDDFYESHFK